MRKTARVSFGILQAALQEAIFTAIFRLLDRPQVCGVDTASLAQVIRSIPAEHAALVDRLKARLRALQEECEALIQWRHKRIAHADLDVATLQVMLDDVTVRSVREAVNGIEEFHRWIAERLYPSDSWTYTGEPLDGDTLMYWLAKGCKQRPPLRGRLRRS